MSTPAPRDPLKRNDDRLILHFDYDCFYASVFEVENPALKALPLAVQQKQIIVTCNYEARRRGLYKLQLVRDAQKLCPDVVIVLGEDISRFRDASKDLYRFLRAFSWNGRVERLGFDEVFMDMTDVVEYNLALLNRHRLADSFFCLSCEDPTVGFAFDATVLPGHAHPNPPRPRNQADAAESALLLRLTLASHLAQWLRHQLEEQKGYTATVGVSTSKLLSKLVGNVHKPHSQTTLVPPYSPLPDGSSNVYAFIDGHEIGKLPGVGFKLATKIRAHVLQRDVEYDPGLVTGRTADTVSTGEVRTHPGVSAELLDRLLAGPGAPRGIGVRVWQLINGVDDGQVGHAREVPRQISVEDSYIRLDTLEEVLKELGMLARSLTRRMRIDLLQDDEEDEEDKAGVEGETVAAAATGDGEPAVARNAAARPLASKRWLAHPRTIRLSTRPRPAPNPDGSRSRSFARISRSAPLPAFIFSLTDGLDALADRLVAEVLLPMFKRLHPERHGWNLSLVNLAVTNMADAASDRAAGGIGRDIGKMFRTQDEVLRAWRVEDRDVPPDVDVDPRGGGEPPQAGDAPATVELAGQGSGDNLAATRRGVVEGVSSTVHDDGWGDDADAPPDEAAETARCDVCGHSMPVFAMAAHARFHSAGE